MTLNLNAPAKINLSLDVLGRRDDGYHAVEMVMQTIGLCDTISLKSRTDGIIQVRCTHPQVPANEENIAYKAASLLKELSGNKRLGATIEIAKNIPAAAGLGGGSADAAAVLKGLNALWDLRLSPGELSRAGLQLGADVPYCLMGGTALARGIGEMLTPLPPPPSFWVVLLKPKAGVSTADVYKRYNEALVRRRPNNEALVAALAAGSEENISKAMANVLESVTFSLLPILGHLKQQALEYGAFASQMTGSGPTIFALASDSRRAAAIYNGLKNQVDFAYITTFKEVP
ncbi:MAG TPA: 4-(cytidine 5'-diphospho)-2-C-methyl-D-erythritol kinase [Bacillota bacterium]|nr:4-(cytidine 5'-diphospho)-2-C-methyl-D-erythritol kinase [Bacillota bacterium]HQD19747.1 4-(cytidine 5'-diphospho)-2-C-methyl-D-erythritol kinase [Bacillota bacterium]